MENSSYSRGALVQMGLQFVPPIIRDSLLRDVNFREEYGLSVDSNLLLGDSGIYFKRSVLFHAVRNFLSGATEIKLNDTDGQIWELNRIDDEGERTVLALCRDEQRLILPDLTVLSPNCDARLDYLEKESSDINLPHESRTFWLNIISQRPLTADEFDEFNADLSDSPVAIARSIESNLIRRTAIPISTMVPPSQRYYDRLIGQYDGSASIKEYAVGSGKKHINELLGWRSYDGFLHSLFLSSHSSLTAEINIDELTLDVILRAFEFIEKHGDYLSRLGVVEIGFRILPSVPEIEPILVRIITKIRDEDANSKGSGFKLFSSLFIFIDGVLSRTRLLCSEPPFYRRLAALSQAALIHRQFVNSTVDIDLFSEWAITYNGKQFYMQSFADMRKEPRWEPDFSAPSQIKPEFFGRIMIAASNFRQNIKDSSLFDLILSTNPDSIQSIGGFPDPFLPGPLEGGDVNQNILPAEIADAIDKQLGVDELGPSSFSALVNSALIFSVRSDHAELAAKALKLSRYRIARIEERWQLLSILNGLATVAAVTRSGLLADELRILARIYRLDAAFRLSIDEVLRVCLIAAASHEDANEWITFVGDWLTELAFGDLQIEEGEQLYSVLQCLLKAVPKLWISCGRADAALKAYNIN